MKPINFRVAALGSGLLFCAVVIFATRVGAQTAPTVYNDNAAWCWYQDERAIIVNNQLIFSSVGDASGTGGSARDGDIEVTTVNLSTMNSQIFTLCDALETGDDHDAAAFMVRPDGNILAVYCKHGGDSLVRWRITTNPGDTTSWTAQQSLNVNSNYGATYENLYRLSSSGLTYNFYRGQDYNPNVLVSSNNGSTWSIAGRLIRTGAGTRPYAKYASNGVDKVYFTYTDGHPHNLVTNLYCAYMQGSNIYNMSGALIGTVDTSSTSGIAPSAGTKIFDAASNGNNRAWCTDMLLDTAGNPVAAYSVYKTNDDHRYRYAKWNGTSWSDHEIAYAGQCLYTAEEHYTGLISINPSDVNTVYISTNADPVRGTALTSSADGKRHWEVYRGFTNDGGTTWSWTAVTANSTADNLRPNLPVWNTTHTALSFMRGTYTSWTNWDTDAVGYVFEGGNGIWANASGGTWSTSSTSNWQGGIVGYGKLGIADFSTLDVSGTATVQLASDLTIGTVVFGDKNTATTGKWVVSPTGSAKLTLENIGVSVPAITANAQATINATLAGTQGLIVNGTGTVTLNGANTYSGTTALNGGTIRTANATALGSASNVLVVTGGTGSAKLAIAAGSQLNKTITLNGRGASVSANLAPHIISEGGTTVLNGNISFVAGGYDYIIQSDAGEFTLNGNITNDVSASSLTRYLHFQGDGDGIYAGQILSGSGTGAICVLKDGAGKWSLTQDLTTAGSVTVSKGELDAAGVKASSVSVAGDAVLVVGTLVADTLVLGSTGETAISSASVLPEDDLSSASSVAVPEPTAWAGLAALTGLALANVRRRNKRGHANNA